MGRQIVKTLHWARPDSWGKPNAKGLTPTDRLRRAAEVKQPVLERLEIFPGVRIIDPMQGSLMAIVSASSAAWTRLLDPATNIIPETVTVKDNDASFSLLRNTPRGHRLKESPILT